MQVCNISSCTHVFNLVLVGPLPDTDSADSIVCYIADTIDHEECVLAGLEVLSDMLQANVAAQEKGGPPQPRIFLDQRSKNLISLAMWDNQANCEVQIAGFTVLTALVNDGKVMVEKDSVLMVWSKKQYLQYDILNQIPFTFTAFIYVISLSPYSHDQLMMGIYL